ncbi:unnamed protein product, partial [Durusdinium trenchii]
MDAAEEPAAAGSVMEPPAAGSVLEAPVAKAAGPAGPPPPVFVPDEPNISGSTVHGVLLEGKDLLEIPVEEILALSLSSIEPAESLINDVCYEVSKTEAERWHRAADLAQDNVYRLKAQMDQLVRLKPNHHPLVLARQIGMGQVSGTGKTVNTPLKEVIMGVSKVVSQLDGTVTKQSKSLEKISTLLEMLCSSMKELISVEQKKSTLVSQMSQAAKATSMAGTPTTPASVPGIAPPGSAPSGLVTPPTTGGAPQATLGTGHVASTSPPPAPKLMPTNLTPPMPSGFPPVPAFMGQNYGTTPA